MKILHLCLAAFYIDNYGYQENILPKIHKLQGHQVKICASTETYLNNKKLGYVQASTYQNEYGIEVTRLPYVSWLPLAIAKKLRIYRGIYSLIADFAPEVIFIHDVQFVGVKEVVKYLKKHAKIRVYVDGHTDFINSGKNWISKNIMHKIIYRWCANKIEPYVRKFYGTLPLRMDFYHDVYGVPKDKLDLLVLGADHTVIDLKQRNLLRMKVRKQLNIAPNTFVIICGGKIDERKNIHGLMEAVIQMNNEGLEVHLILFGMPDVFMKEKIEILSQPEFIHNVGWQKPSEIYKYLFAADLGCFPGTHSVLWEQCIGVGLPCLFKRWKGIEHIDIGGNCLFLEQGNVSELKTVISTLYKNRNELAHMKKVSLEKGMKEFSYEEIAKRAIELI